jgi:hypothetical protein
MGLLRDFGLPFSWSKAVQCAGGTSLELLQASTPFDPGDASLFPDQEMAVYLKTLLGKLCCVVAFFVVGGLALGSEPSPSRIGELIHQLGSEEYTEREAASKALKSIGIPALVALEQAAAESDDPEVQLRAADLLPAIRAREQALALDTLAKLKRCLEPIPGGAYGIAKFLMLDLNQSAVTDADLSKLRHLEGINGVTLASTRITDAGLVSLASVEGLVLLKLDNTPITDTGLQHLKSCKTLRYLRLVNTRVTNDGLTNLKGCESLGVLDVSGTRVSAAGMADLKKALPHLKIIGP